MWQKLSLQSFYAGLPEIMRTLLYTSTLTMEADEANG
jgi:hypothetical protein